MKKINIIVSTFLLGCTFVACNDNLEITPPSSIIPEDYLTEESQLDSYVINLYPNLPMQVVDLAWIMPLTMKPV